jgi:hypothetical protein
MYDPAVETASQVLNSRFPNPVIYGIISQVNRYLQKYKDEHDGQPLTDENGEIKMGTTVI